MSFWKDKKVLVTGASGFVGSNLTKRLLKEGARVVAIARGGLGNKTLLDIEGLSDEVEKVEKVDISNSKEVLSVVGENDIEVVYHLAAQPLVELGRESPIKTFEVNIKGTWNILEAGRRLDVEKVVVASSTHVYGDNPNLPYKEDYYPQPSRPYETSKACADLLSQSFADTYSLQVEIPRFVNLYGPGDANRSRIVPKVLLSALKGENPEIFDVGAVRDFLFIDDAIDAYMLLVEKDLPSTKRSRIFNFGTGEPVKIVDLAKKIIELVDKKDVELVIKNPPKGREKEIAKQYVSVEKAKRELGWEPKYTLEEGLQKTIDWYKKHESIII